MVSARTISCGLWAWTSSASSKTPLRLHASLEGTAERRSDGDRDSLPVGVRSVAKAARELARPLQRGALIALAEGVCRRKRVVHLVYVARQSALVPTLVEYQAGEDGVPVARKPRHDLLGAGHLRNPIGVDEADRLHARQPGGRQPVTELRPHGWGQ